MENTQTRHKNISRVSNQQYNTIILLVQALEFKDCLVTNYQAVPLYILRMTNDWGRCWANWDNRKCRKGTYDQNVIPYGKCEIDFAIELHSNYPTWKDFIETLAHEMVHLYQMTILEDPYSNHNANFFAFRNKFRLAGLDLSRTG